VFNSGADFHDTTAERLNITRQKAKVFNLSAGYRGTPGLFSYQLKCSFPEAERELARWWALWPDLYLWENNLINETKGRGFIKTLLGRIIYVDNLDSFDKKVRQTAERRVIENLAQGSVSDLIGLAMIQLHKEGFLLVNQIHDSVLLEVDEDYLEPSIEKAIEIMENVVKLAVPIKVEAKVGMNWGEMAKVGELHV